MLECFRRDPKMCEASFSWRAGLPAWKTRLLVERLQGAVESRRDTESIKFCLPEVEETAQASVASGCKLIELHHAIFDTYTQRQQDEHSQMPPCECLILRKRQTSDHVSQVYPMVKTIVEDYTLEWPDDASRTAAKPILRSDNFSGSGFETLSQRYSGKVKVGTRIGNSLEVLDETCPVLTGVLHSPTEDTNEEVSSFLFDQDPEIPDEERVGVYTMLANSSFVLAYRIYLAVSLELSTTHYNMPISAVEEEICLQRLEVSKRKVEILLDMVPERGDVSDDRIRRLFIGIMSHSIAGGELDSSMIPI